MGAGTLINLHSHTTYSDGSFSPREIVEAAAKGGLTHIAITDHFETSKVARCLRASQLDEYRSEIESLGHDRDGLRVLAGVEIDTSPLRTDLDALPIDHLNQLDLVLLEYVNNWDVAGSALNELDRLISRLDVPVGLAHTDLVNAFSGIAPEEVADLLRSYGLFVEVNTAAFYSKAGVPYYQRSRGHFAAFKGKVKISVGTDVHRDIAEVSNVRHGYEFVRELGLEEMLLM
ncbi:MAG: CpsB/CapC family capsule biosynthesis tyrosine phosphatase [Methanomassiliicoccales archaeon]|jgi:DNA polymerase (family 10)